MIMKGHGINYGIQEMSYFYRVRGPRSGLDTPIFIKRYLKINFVIRCLWLIKLALPSRKGGKRNLPFLFES